MDRISILLETLPRESTISILYESSVAVVVAQFVKVASCAQPPIIPPDVSTAVIVPLFADADTVVVPQTPVAAT